MQETVSQKSLNNMSGSRHLHIVKMTKKSLVRCLTKPINHDLPWRFGDYCHVMEKSRFLACIRRSTFVFDAQDGKSCRRERLVRDGKLFEMQSEKDSFVQKFA